MSEAPSWPEAVLSTIRHMRRAGKSWPEIGETLQVCPDAARRQGYKMNLPRIRGQKRAGPLPRQPRAVAETQPLQRKPEQLAGTRPTLPPGATWSLLTAGTCLDGQPYSEPMDRRA